MLQRHTEFGNQFYQSHFGISNEIYRGCTAPPNSTSGQWNQNASSCDICMLQVDFIPVTYPDYTYSNQNSCSSNPPNTITNSSANNSRGIVLL